jgi:glycerol-3-phosphate dehydrogenase
MAETIEDVLARRVRLLFLDARAAIDSARKVAEIFAQELGWDAEKVENETESFISLAKEYLLVPYNTNEMKNSK